LLAWGKGPAQENLNNSLILNFLDLSPSLCLYNSYNNFSLRAYPKIR
jgi:hypothetical protein